MSRCSSACAEALVENLHGAFARIWTLNPQGDVLELRASAGLYTHLDGPHSRVPVGQYKIGLIAQERKPHLTNAVVGDPRVGDQEWAKREGMVAFAGYPLVVDDRLVGVMAMFARQPLSETTLEAMASVADEIAVGIERKVGEERLHEQREWLSVTLASIGDAVITTDTEGRVTFLNGVAQALTGWRSEEAQGQPLEAVFPILNEQTRQPVENPVERVLREGVVVGLANHTVLIARDGAERPVDDSAAPIRDGTGKMIGVVLVFRDVAEQRRAEQQRNARLGVTHALSEAATVEDGATGLLRAVCENLGWDMGLFWTVNEQGQALVCRQSWHRPDVPVEEFERASCSRTFAMGEGLPGRAWATGGPAWILDIAHDADFRRLVSAVNHGLHSALACPVTVGEQTLGVVEFFIRRIREPDPGLLEMMNTVAGQIGQFIERREAEDRVRRSERELADFFENATEGLHWVGPDGTILRANRAELDLLGYTAEEYVGHKIAEFHADEGVIADILRRLQAGEELHNYEARLRCKDGSLRHVLINSNVMRRDGQFAHTRCFTRDVTGRPAARRSWQGRNECWNCSSRGHHCPTCWIRCARSSKARAGTNASPRSCSWMKTGSACARSPGGGHPPTTQRRWTACRSGRASARAGRRRTGASRSSSPTSPPTRCGRSPPPSVTWPLGHGLRACWSTPILSSQGRVLGTFAVYYPTPRRPSADEMRLVDILTRTAAVAVERRRDEEALRETDRRKDEFLATLAHELRNPLAPMRNALQVIQLAGNDAAAVGHAREMMERQMRHMVRLVDDLLDVSRITRGKLELRKQRVDLAAVVRTAVETSRPLIEAAGHHLTITPPPQPVFVDGDPVRLAQVFSNLLNNAAKYTDRGGKIWLTAEREGSDAVVSVRDSGLGIPREMLGKVFELFTQVDSTLEKAQGGLGIGLTLVRRLAEMHGGSVEAHSEGTGKGSEFTVPPPGPICCPRP